MRRYLKKDIVKVLDIMIQANDILAKNLISNQVGNAKALADDLLDSADNIYNSIPETCKAEQKCKDFLNGYMETLAKAFSAKKPAEKISVCALMKKKLSRIKEAVLEEIPNDKLQMVFMPYKAEMWTSMESIWKEAMRDDECEVRVVPIPYYDITNPNNISFHYEIERFPSDVECISYEEYSEEICYPDIIVIHNPYDDTNNMTKVPERFYSSKLIESTAKLVYAPYFTMGLYKEENNAWVLTAPANINADIILAQSERVKKIYTDMGFVGEKILTYGSPKVDAIVNMDRKQVMKKIPDEWKEKVEGKKVFLLNTHLSYFPNCTKLMESKKTRINYAAKFHDEILKAFLNREDCALIWRPHPLMKTMIKGRFPQWLDYIESMERRIRESNNGIIDDLGDYSCSFYLSDALMTTYSSLINEYMVLGKPLLIYQTKLEEEAAATMPINLNVNYFRVGAGAITFEKFRDNVLQGIDPQGSERMEEIRNAFPNLDGKAGEKIYRYLKEY